MVNNHYKYTIILPLKVAITINMFHNPTTTHTCRVHTYRN